ncbi:hypothetical protein ACWV26_12440 [Rummeliibacillus sp. JY-2-4R]
MKYVHFFENRTNVLSQILESVPSVDTPVKIKGRKGKVVEVNIIGENIFHVKVVFEIVKKKIPVFKDDRNKKRR